MRLSDYVIKYLKEEHQVDTIFTVSGGGCIFLIDSLTNIEGVEYIATHHEQAAAIAAEGYARMNGKLGACLVTSGPGGTNAITGVLGAWLDSIPMIVISGQVNRDMTTNNTNLKVRQLGDQEFDIVKSVKHITKYAEQVNQPLLIKYHLDKACRTAKEGRPGPVWLDIPLDVQSTQIDPDKLNGYCNEYEKPRISHNAIEVVVDKLLNAKKPLLIVGNGIRLADGVKELHQLLKQTNIPVISAVNGNDLVNDDYKGYAGRFGTHAQICANTLLGEADVVVSIGSRLYVRQIGYNFDGFAKQAYKIYVDIDKEELLKPTLRPDFPIIADAKDFLKALLNHKSLPTYDRSTDWFQHCEVLYRNTPQVLNKHREKTTHVSHYHFMETLSNMLTEGDHIVTSDGSAHVVTMQVMKLSGKQRLITNSGSAPMGYGLPAAIGAAAKGDNIICIEGDGSLHLNIHELQTLKHYNLPVKVILLNNEGYTSIKISQKTFFKGKFVASEKGSGVSFPNFEKIIKAYDLPYRSIKTHWGMKKSLEEFLRLEGPCVLEVFTDPEEYHEPKVIAKLGPDGKFIPGNLHDIKWID